MSDTTQNGPGAELKSAREGMDVGTREVADALNLPAHVIEALEADDYERLPPTVFTRGYLRSYARLLELSPESLLARYPEVTEEIDAITAELPVVEPPAGAPAKTLSIAAGVGVVLIALLVWLLGGDESSDQPDSAPITSVPETGTEDVVSSEPESPTTPEPVNRAEDEAVSAQTNTSDAADPGEAVAAEAAPSRAATSTGPESQEPAEALETATREPEEEPETSSEPAVLTPEPTTATAPVSSATNEAATAPGTRERRITEFGEDTITFVFSEDCWVEVKSLDGENLYSDLNRTGRTLVLTGRAPFRILLGYAPGVALSFNGEPVALERYSRNNVANLVLGE